jgi:hypothetical protein
MANKITIFAVLVAAGTLAACASGPSGEEGVSGSSMPAAAGAGGGTGYADGCAHGYEDAGIVAYVGRPKNRPLLANDEAYRKAYDAGYASCYKQQSDLMHSD